MSDIGTQYVELQGGPYGGEIRKMRKRVPATLRIGADMAVYRRKSRNGVLWVFDEAKTAAEAEKRGS